jgi:hypothetical protein
MKLGHSGVKVRNHTMRPRPLPPRENPLGVPRAIQKELSKQNLPPNVDAYNARLQELLQKG